MTGGHEHHMRRALRHGARQAHWAFRVRDTGHGAAAAIAAVHDRGIQLRQAVAVEHGTDAGIEQRAILQTQHQALDGIDGAAAITGDGLRNGAMPRCVSVAGVQIAGATIVE